MRTHRECDAKRFYDTEFEAKVASARSEANFDAPMMHYQCGSHWHVANVVKENRSKYREYNKTYCDVCDQYMKAKTYPKHIQMGRHMRLLEKHRKGPPKESNLPSTAS